VPAHHGQALRLKPSLDLGSAPVGWREAIIGTIRTHRNACWSSRTLAAGACGAVRR
jgi:hypothetical protein